MIKTEIQKQLTLMFGVVNTPPTNSRLIGDSCKQSSLVRVVLDSDHEQEENAPVQKKKEEQLPPPEHSPFEVIPGLDQRNLSSLFLNKNSKYQLPETSEVDASKMMSREQYQALFKSLDLTDANISLKKFI